MRALGGLDELNALLGTVLAEASLPEEIRGVLSRIQSVLFEAGFELASAHTAGAAELFAAETIWLEQRIDEMEAALPPLTRFVLPGGGRAGAGIHLARTVARRAESQVVEVLGRGEMKGPKDQGAASHGHNPEGHNPAEPSPLLSWLNRVSDALFVLARRANQLEGIHEVQWETRMRRQGGA